MIHAPCGLEAMAMRAGKFHACRLRVMRRLAPRAPGSCVSLSAFPRRQGGGVSPPHGQAGVSRCVLGLHQPSSHRFASPSPEAVPLLPRRDHFHVQKPADPAEQQRERIRGKQPPGTILAAPGAQRSGIHLLATHSGAAGGVPAPDQPWGHLRGSG